MAVIEEVTFHCRTQIEIKKLNYIWTIDNFWDILNNTVVLRSEEVTDYFQLYMKHKDDVLEIFASRDEENSIQIFCSMFFMTTTGEKLWGSTSYVFCHETLPLISLPLFSIKISDLKKDKDIYILKDKLKMRFDCTLFHKSCNQFISYVHILEELIKTKVKELTSDEVDELEFVINGKSFTISKVLLASHSEFFEDMFSKESISKIELNDITYDTFRHLISFVETGQLDKEIKTNVGMLCDLLVTADKYNMKNLKLICEQRMINNVTVQNVSDILEIAHSYNAKILKKYITDFIQLYFDDIVNSIQFLTLTRKFPEILIKTQNIRISEGFINV